MIKAGTRVTVEPTAPGSQGCSPAAAWIEGECTVLLLDDAPDHGTLDVLDVIDPDGEENTIYDFNIIGPVPFQ